MNTNKIAQAISLLLNAPIVAAFTFSTLLLSIGPENFQGLILTTLTFGTLVPLITLYGLKKQGAIPDIYVSQRERRAIPFVAAIVSYSVGAIALLWVKAPSIVTALMLCYLGNSLIMMLVTAKWKISVHASGVTGPATVLIYYFGLAALPFVLLAIPVAWARVKLGAHNLAQVSAGGVLTILTTYLQLRVYLTLL